MNDGPTARGERYALITCLIDQLREHESWTGATHVQKAAFLLKELHGIDTGCPFVLYHHGPYSFELTDELAAMKRVGFLAVEPTTTSYGVRIRYSATAEGRAHAAVALEASRSKAISEIAALVDGRGVVALEALATAVYVARTEPDLDFEERTTRLAEIKPHLDRPLIVKATHEVLGLLSL